MATKPQRKVVISFSTDEKKGAFVTLSDSRSRRENHKKKLEDHPCQVQ